MILMCNKVCARKSDFCTEPHFPIACICFLYECWIQIRAHTQMHPHRVIFSANQRWCAVSVRARAKCVPIIHSSTPDFTSYCCFTRSSSFLSNFLVVRLRFFSIFCLCKSLCSRRTITRFWANYDVSCVCMRWWTSCFSLGFFADPNVSQFYYFCRTATAIWICFKLICFRFDSMVSEIAGDLCSTYRQKHA
jgi:hypothetical protein